jgi:hypothetical protein
LHCRQCSLGGWLSPTPTPWSAVFLYTRTHCFKIPRPPLTLNEPAQSCRSAAGQLCPFPLRKSACANLGSQVTNVAPFAGACALGWPGGVEVQGSLSVWSFHCPSAWNGPNLSFCPGFQHNPEHWPIGLAEEVNCSPVVSQWAHTGCARLAGVLSLNLEQGLQAASAWKSWQKGTGNFVLLFYPDTSSP